MGDSCLVFLEVWMKNDGKPCSRNPEQGVANICDVSSLRKRKVHIPPREKK